MSIIVSSSLNVASGYFATLFSLQSKTFRWRNTAVGGFDKVPLGAASIRLFLSVTPDYVASDACGAAPGACRTALIAFSPCSAPCDGRSLYFLFV